MKKSLFTKPLKQTVLAVPAAALMLGAAQAGTTIGLNFQTWYYDSKTTPQTIGFGSGYQTTGFPVTAKAFGVDATNWFNPDPLPAQTAIATTVTFGGVNTTFAGGLSAYVTAPNAWQSGIGEQVAGWNPETVAPGNNEVTWGYLDSNSGQTPTASVSGLAAKFPNGYVVQTIAAEAGTSGFANVDVTDGTTTSTLIYSNSFVRGSASDGYYSGNGTVGLSTPSASFSSDTININCQAQPQPQPSPAVRSTLAGFIITDQPVVSQNPVGGAFLPGATVTLSAMVAALPNGLSYQWRSNGVPIVGATSLTYVKTNTTPADSANYDLVVNNLYGSATSAVATVVVALPSTLTWDADTGTTGAQDGSGTWDLANSNWWNGSGNAPWLILDTAIFGVGGTDAYTVTLGTSLSAETVTFNSGNYTITNTGGASLTLTSGKGISTSGDAKIAVPFSTGTNDLIKLGTGTLTLGGPVTAAGTTRVLAGTLEVQARSADGPYVVTNGTTLKLGYSTGGGYASTKMQLYGDGTAATTGLYLAGGRRYNVSGGLLVSGAPTTIRQYGTGLAGLGIFDINSNPGLSISAEASGSVADANIQLISRGYGMVVTTAAGSNTATGDFVLNGPLNVGSMGLYKRGSGSMRLNATALTNMSLQVQGGTVICGTNDCIGANASLSISTGATLDLNGFSQTVSNNYTLMAGTLKMAIHKGGATSCDVLTTTDPANALFCGGNLVVTNLGAVPVLGDSFTLFHSGAGYMSGSFVTVTLPLLSDGLAWQDSLATDGSIKVIAGSVPPSITVNLTPTKYAYAGANVSLTVVAAGDAVLHYQWKKNGTTSVGTDSPTLVLPAVTVQDAADYSVTVVNRYGQAPSQTTHLTVLTPSTYAATAIRDGAMAFWPLAETTGTTAYDYVGGHDGTQNGAITLGAAGPRPPACQGFASGTTAYQLDGLSAYVDCGPTAALSGTTDFTLEAWLNTTNTTSTGYIIQQRSGYNGEYMFTLNGIGRLNFTVYGGGNYQANLTTPRAGRRLNDGKWHHVAAVRSSAYCAIYVDGALAVSGTGPAVTLDPSFTVAIGKDARDGGSFFNGLLCNVAIYNHALTGPQIGAHAYAGILGTSPLTLSIVPGGWVEDSKPAGTLHHGRNLGPTWVATSTDAAATPVTRTGVAQFASGAQVSVPTDADFDTPTGTICFWLRAPYPATGNGTILFDRRTTSGLLFFLDGTPTGGIDVQYTGGASFTTAQFVTDGNWHHVALVYDQSASGSVSLYVDGSLAQSQPNTSAWNWPTNQPIELGRSHDTYWQEYLGQMDDFRVYSRILTPTEISTLATAATSDTLVDTTKLTVRYNFGTAAGVGQSLSWPLGTLLSSPALGPSAAWTPVGNAVSPYPWLLPPPAMPTNSALFYGIGM